MKDNKTYIKHILNAINQISIYTNGLDYSDFSKNHLVIDGVIRQLEIVGEASNNLSPDFLLLHPEIDLRDAIDMRNFLVHEYFGVRTKTVWDTCQDDLPKLKEMLLTLL